MSARPRLRRRRRRAQGEHPGPRPEAEPGGSPFGRREGRPRRDCWRAAAQSAAGARRRGRPPRRHESAVPGRGRGRGAGDVADGKHDPRGHAPRRRVRRHGGPNRCGRARRGGRPSLRRLGAACQAAPAPGQGRARAAGRVPGRRDQPRDDDRLYARRRR
jgi:hypothetical protein